MAFIEIRPHAVRMDSDYLSDKVRVRFPIIKNTQQMIMYIGIDVAKRFKLSKGDRVILLVKKDHELIWQLKKCDDGFKLGSQGKHLKLQIAWGKKEIPQDWKKMKFVKIEEVEGRMQIVFPHDNAECKVKRE